MISTSLRVATLARCLCGLLAILSYTGLMKNAAGQPPSAQMPKIDLAGRSFSLLSTVLGQHGPDTRPELLYTLDEMHSAWQRRSRLQLDTAAKHLHSFDIDDDDDDDETKKQNGSGTKTTEDATFYADDKQLLLVVNDESCVSIGFHLLDQMLSLGFLFDCSWEQTHMIGAARVLQFIDKNRDKFTMVTEDSKRQVQGNYLQFGADFTISPTNSFRITVDYSEDVALNLPRGIPRSVNIANSRLSSRLSYSFKRYKPLARYRLHHGSSHLEGYDHPDGGSIAFDSFAFPHGLGCSRELGPEDNEVLARKARGPQRFSFVAHQDHDSSSSTVVAYEPTLNTLRVDEVGQTRSIKITTNYNQDRTYHVLNRLASQDLMLDGVLQVRQNEHIDDNLNCAVLKATRENPRRGADRRTPHTLGRMLLGSQRLAYLGLARVRGVEARVYEAHDSEWPIWVQQPAVFRVRQPGSNETDESDLVARGELESVKKLPAQRTSLFYFRRVADASQDDEFLSSQLLRIEVFLVKQDEHRARPFKSGFDIYDFSWHLKAVAPNGARYEDFLSLGNDCLSPPSEDNRFARLDLLLEADGGQPKPGHERDDSWLLDSIKRNLALLRAVRDQLGLPSTMIYDIESRYLQTSSESSTSRRHLLPLVVRAARRTKALAALIYTGRVSINPQQESRLMKIVPLTFQMCHAIAAHQRRDTLFAYNVLGECLLVGDHADSEMEQLDDHHERSALETIFALDPDGLLELYQVKHHVKAKLTIDDLFADFERTRRLLSDSFGLILTDSTREEDNDSDSDNDNDSDNDKAKQPAVQAGQAIFKIRRLSMDYLDDKQPYELDEQHLSSTNKFEGFGLVPSDQQNRLILPKRLEVGSTSEKQEESGMTFEQCQAACLLDLKCQSYSSCIVAGQIECILSNVSFASPTIVLQLMVLRDQKAKFGETFSLSLEPEEPEGPMESIKVKRHPTCELHNKRYLDLFSKTANEVFNLARAQTYHFEAVTSLEQCAELCFRSTLDYLRYENEQLSTSWSQHLQGANRKQEGQAEQKKTCDSFIYLDYLDAERAGVLEAIAKLTVDGGFFEGSPSGFCRIDKPNSEWRMMLPVTDDVERSKDSSQGRRLEAIKYSFDFSTLYERRPGVSLIETPKSVEERSAFFNSDIEQDEKKAQANRLVLEAFVERGENSGRTRAIGRAEDCARHCFEQFTLLWPGCRSFDYIEVIGANKRLVQAYCAFNTATLRQTQLLERFDLVRWSPDKQERVALYDGNTARVHHYDPKEGLAASSLDELYRVARVSPGARQAPRPSSAISFRPFWLLVNVLFALAIGLVLGSYLGTRYLKAWFKNEGDQQGLVEEGGRSQKGSIMPVFELPELENQL